MLRVFIDTINKASSEDIEGINVQYLSIVDKLENEKDCSRFLDYIDRSISLGDQIIILSKTKFNLLFDSDNFRNILAPLDYQGMEILIKKIIKYKDQGLDKIEEEINKSLELFELFYYLLVGI